MGRRLVRAGGAHRSPAEKHKGLTVLLVDMKSPGVEVRGLKQMSGESEFCEIFFRDVRVPVENVVGKVNEGWKVAMGTLMHERGTFGAALAGELQAQFQSAGRDRAPGTRNGHTAAEDPLMRQKLGAVLRRNRSDALQSDARVQPHQ
jgi:alkylation response protein AidB-like acyl-CoA dehydrogenase